MMEATITPNRKRNVFGGMPCVSVGEFDTARSKGDAWHRDGGDYMVWGDVIKRVCITRDAHVFEEYTD